MDQIFAPGSRIVVRDAEWLVRRVDRTSSGGQAVSCVGLSELVREKEATFLTEIENENQADSQKSVEYRVSINRNHSPSVQFTSLAHELGHLYLGHLVPDKALKIPQRPQIDHKQAELEAESVAYLVCARNGVTSKSETYLSDYVEQNTTIENIDIYQIMRAAGQVETLLDLTAHTKYDTPQMKGR